MTPFHHISNEILLVTLHCMTYSLVRNGSMSFGHEEGIRSTVPCGWTVATTPGDQKVQFIVGGRGRAE